MRMSFAKTVLVSALLAASSGIVPAEVDFSRDIRPLLSDKCFACHGPDKKTRKAKLRLDVREGIETAIDDRHPVVPGKPDESELFRRITTSDADEIMPPAEFNKTLTTAEVELLRQWITEGAKWEDHWSLQPPTSSGVPNATLPAGDGNEVDRFIIARLQRERMTPAPLVDRATLLRRVSLTLTGLPPRETDKSFLTDETPDAYSRLVDRLLASEHYGEHMTRYWLDAVRYGDTHGLHLDNYREIWPYRDWVIQAFNKDLPYDRFVTEQLAGDLLPNPTSEQLIATGFNRCHVTTSEGGSIKEEVYTRNVVDRVTTFGTIFLGMSLDCTRCHDHKYDPFTMKDFYSLFAFYNSIDGEPLDGNRPDPEPVIEAPSPEQSHLRKKLTTQVSQLVALVEKPDSSLDRQQRRWEKQIAGVGVTNKIALSEWSTIGPFYVFRLNVDRKEGPENEYLKNNSLDLAKEHNGRREKLKWTRRPEWVDNEPHLDLPGRMSVNYAYRQIESPDARTVKIGLGGADGYKLFLNGKELLSDDEKQDLEAGEHQIELKLNPGTNHVLLKVGNFDYGRSGFQFNMDPSLVSTPSAIRALASKPAKDRSAADAARLRDWYRYQVAERKSLRQTVAALNEARLALADVVREIPTTLVWKERSAPRDAFILTRGEYDQKGDPVFRGTPAILPPLKSGMPTNRLGLAQWLTDPDHPLFARVTVNRLWQQVFGTGLVKSAEDFGSQGEPPSHPELLDWLALRFRQDHWSVKTFMKRLVLSRAFRQSSRITTASFQRDPENRLLARGPRNRLDAEALRDQALAISGLLNPKLGGPAVKPPQPDGLWKAVAYSASNTAQFEADTEDDQVHRRTIYTFYKRTAVAPQLNTFDAPSREACVVRRERTNTPLQALLMMNDPQYLDAARALARRVIGLPVSDRDRSRNLLELCTSRPAEVWETDELLRVYQANLKDYRANLEAARMLTTADNPSAENSSPELAAWILCANLALNLDEVINLN
jgi:hypothetical protein